MNAIIANILKERIGHLDFISKTAGLVHVAEKLQPTDIDGAFIVSKFPISNDVEYNQCINTGGYKDLIPNSYTNGILYFEDFGNTPLGRSKGAFEYRSKLRLVVWFNNKLIQGSNKKSISHFLITEIRNKLETGYFNSQGITRIKVNAINIVGNDYKLFERYTYPNDILKFLMYPYEAFGIDLNVEYSINDNCLTDYYKGISVC